MIKRISIVGAGGWGTALAVLLAETQASIQLWGHNPAVVNEITERRTNSQYLPGISLPENVAATGNLAEVLDGEIILMVTPSKALREVSQAIAAIGVASETAFVSCVKGIEHTSGKLMSQIIEENLPNNPVAVLSGPNLAGEVAHRIPAAGVIGCRHPEWLKKLQGIFSQGSFRAYTSEDVEGIQLGGALKNVFAIAAGVSDGFKMGDNAKAGLVTRSLAEMMRLGVAMGGKRESFYGLSGIGDLMVTCFSKQSRNRSVGERLGRGETPAQIQESMKMVAEGIPTAKAVSECAQRMGLEAPISQEIYAVLYENKKPLDAMWGLLGRAPRSEHEAAR